VPIRKGEAWGGTGAAPDGMVVVGSDGELNTLVTRCRRAGEPLPPVGLLGGDLMRCVGGSGDPTRFAGEVALLPVDVVRVDTPEATGWFVAHLLARRAWWRGDLTAVMNGQYLGSWDVAPRAHPGDGRVDVVRVDRAMSLRDRRTAKRRLPLGAHLPHPHISVRQAASIDLVWRRPTRVWLDGRPWATVREATVTVESEPLLVCV
jgi:hypothetical protein